MKQPVLLCLGKQLTGYGIDGIVLITATDTHLPVSNGNGELTVSISHGIDASGDKGHQRYGHRHGTAGLKQQHSGVVVGIVSLEANLYITSRFG